MYAYLVQDCACMNVEADVVWLKVCRRGRTYQSDGNQREILMKMIEVEVEEDEN